MPRKRNQDLVHAVGQRVARARRERGWTQERLSEAVDIQAVTLSRLENGDRALSLSTLGRIADALKVSLGDLVDGSRSLPAPKQSPQEAELLRLYGQLTKSRRQLLLRLARELAPAKR